MTFEEIGFGEITPKNDKNGKTSDVQKAMKKQAEIARGVNEGSISREDAVILYQDLKNPTTEK